MAGRVRVDGQHRQRRDEVLAAAEVEAGGGLVEEQQLGVGHQRPGDLHPLALALAERAEGPVGQVADAELDEQLRRRGSWSRSSYSSRQRPTTPYDADTTTSCTRSSRGIRSASAALVRPIRGRSSKTSTVPSTSPRIAGDARRSGGSGRRRPAAGWSCRRRWGRGSPSARPPRPSSRRSSSRMASPRRTRDVGELEHGGHGGHPIALRQRCSRRSVTGRAEPLARRPPGWPGGAPPGCAGTWSPTTLLDAVVGDDATHASLGRPDGAAGGRWSPASAGSARAARDRRRRGAARPRATRSAWADPRRSTPPRSRPARRCVVERRRRSGLVPDRAGRR